MAHSARAARQDTERAVRKVYFQPPIKDVDMAFKLRGRYGLLHQYLFSKLPPFASPFLRLFCCVLFWSLF